MVVILGEDHSADNCSELYLVRAFVLVQAAVYVETNYYYHYSCLLSASTALWKVLPDLKHVVLLYQCLNGRQQSLIDMPQHAKQRPAMSFTKRQDCS